MEANTVLLERDSRAWQSDDAAGQAKSTAAVDVSICIANWNCRDYLRLCLQSLCEFDHGVALEIIVVDNGSTDGAPEMVAKDFPEVRLIRNLHNRGFARANNQAMRVAGGRYLLFLNNDTVVELSALKKMVDHLDTHPDVVMVGPQLRDAAGKTQVSYRPQPTVWWLLHRTTLLRWTRLFRAAYQRYRRKEFDQKSTREVDVLMGAVLLTRSNVLRDSGGWDEDFVFGGEDLELSYRLRRTGTLVYLPDAEVTHFGRVSTRQHVAYASVNIAAGFVTYLRKCDATPFSLFIYKVVMTLDTPLQWCVKAVQYLSRRFSGQQEKAQKSLLAMRSLGCFLVKGLDDFWRA